MSKTTKKPNRVTFDDAEPGETIYMYGDPSKRFVVDTKLEASILLHERGRDPLASRVGLVKQEFEGRWTREPRGYTKFATITEDGPIPTMDHQEFGRVLLTKLRQTATMSFGEHVIKNMDLRVLRNEMTDSILFSLRTSVMKESLSDRKKTVTFKYPETWWQFLKLKHAPKWFKERFPIKYSKTSQTIRFEEIALYPMLPSVCPEHAGECYFQSMFHDDSWGENNREHDHVTVTLGS